MCIIIFIIQIVTLCISIQRGFWWIHPGVNGILPARGRWFVFMEGMVASVFFPENLHMKMLHLEEGGEGKGGREREVVYLIHLPPIVLSACSTLHIFLFERARIPPCRIRKPSSQRRTGWVWVDWMHFQECPGVIEIWDRLSSWAHYFWILFATACHAQPRNFERCSFHSTRLKRK